MRYDPLIEWRAFQLVIVSNTVDKGLVQWGPSDTHFQSQSIAENLWTKMNGMLGLT